MKSEKMNIADLYITEGPIQYKDDPFKVVWRKQTKLMEAYREAGRLSQWPISIEDTKGQAFYRELFGFLEEEIIEASFEVDKLWEAAMQNDEEAVRQTLINLNEEIADGLHFWIETFIFLSFMPRSFENYYAELAKEKYLNSETGEVFKLVFQFAENYLNHSGHKEDSAFTFMLRPMPETFEQAGSSISSSSKKEYDKYTFYTIKYLQLAKNCLKNKAWKSKEYEVNIQRFNELLMEAWINWTISLTILKVRPAALVQNYLLKNKINHDKIKTA